MELLIEAIRGKKKTIYISKFEGGLVLTGKLPCLSFINLISKKHDTNYEQLQIFFITLGK